MKILYIFPHPDDESFGPAAAMAKQRREGHDVYLLTLTRGGATKQRHKLGLTVDEMGEVRYKEMLEVAKVLDLSEMVVLDFPDSGLKEVDPRELEAAVAEAVERIRPDIIVTYPVHGISGFHDHLVSHAVVKRVFCELRGAGATYLKRLAFFTVGEETAEKSEHFKLNNSSGDEIDCVIHASAEDGELMQRALTCYETYREVIDATGIRDTVGKELCYEIYQESFDPPIEDLFQQLD